jgi:hypothetical protein
MGCADIRDRVYAMSALMDSKLSITLDYTKSPSELFESIFEEHLNALESSLARSGIFILCSNLKMTNQSFNERNNMDLLSGSLLGHLRLTRTIRRPMSKSQPWSQRDAWRLGNQMTRRRIGVNIQFSIWTHTQSPIEGKTRQPSSKCNGLDIGGILVATDLPRFSPISSSFYLLLFFIVEIHTHVLVWQLISIPNSEMWCFYSHTTKWNAVSPSYTVLVHNELVRDDPIRGYFKPIAPKDSRLGRSSSTLSANYGQSKFESWLFHEAVHSLLNQNPLIPRHR